MQVGTLEWAIGIKQSLVDLQRQTGIPALFAVAQMVHESNSGGDLSTLATQCYNYAGLKYADWQAAFGCRPVQMDTLEEMHGQDYQTVASFCACTSYEQWLKVYASLLTGQYYGPALAYAADPLLYGYEVWARGWATDSRYVSKVGEWMQKLWPYYEDTLPPRKYRQITVEGNGATIKGELREDTTWVALREAVTQLGLGTVEYVAEGPKVIVRGRQDGWTP